MIAARPQLPEPLFLARPAIMELPHDREASYTEFKGNIKRFVCGMVDNAATLATLVGAVSAAYYSCYSGAPLGEDDIASTLDKLSRATLFGALGGLATSVPAKTVSSIANLVIRSVIDLA